MRPGFFGTSAQNAYDGNISTYYRAEGKIENQAVTIDLGCLATVRGFRRYMTTNPSSPQPPNRGPRSSEGFSVSEQPLSAGTLVTPENSTGWESYGALTSAWVNVDYGWSSWLRLRSPIRARYINFGWVDQAGPGLDLSRPDDFWDALSEIEIEYELDRPPVPGTADLAVTLSGPRVTLASVAAVIGLKHVATITNNGPETARDVSLSVSAGQLRDHYSFPTLAAGASVTKEFFVGLPSTAPTVSVAQSAAEVRGSPSDPHLHNNAAQFSTTIVNCQAVDRENEACLLNYLAGTPCSGSSRSGPGVMTAALRLLGQTVDLPFEIDTFHRLRDEVLTKSAAGRRYRELYYTHARELVSLAVSNPPLASSAITTLNLWEPGLRALVDGRGGTVAVSPEALASLSGFLAEVKRLGSAELRAAIEREEAALDLPALVGKTMNQALERQSQTATIARALPAGASIHGAGGSFFHSDVRVLNPSTTAPATVTATYRCLAGACASEAQMFTVAPRAMRVLDDAVTTLFGAPESAGPIEIQGGVLVSSRLYTPSRPDPTLGMSVPGVPDDEAYPEAVLTSLSRSVDASAGFRTNVGVYNRHDVPLAVTVTLFDVVGREIGRTSRTVAARSAVQINDVFTDAGVVGDVDDAYANVRADGVRELFAYATVVDNRSQDGIFVKGRNARGGPSGTWTLPAAASVHGAGGSFFHSDVRVFNPSSTTPATVSALYRCFTGACDGTPRTFTVAPREMKVFNDAVAILFGAPESAGAIEMTGDVLVDSRVYTPSRPAPTTGFYVPGLAETEAYPEAVLTSLSHSADPTRGFRTNVGVYNPGGFPLSVVFALYDSAGTRIGQVSRSVAGQSALQVNSVFLAAGIATDVPDAYAIVTADRAQKIFAYATVVDNQSQDGIFVAGESPEPPR